MARVQDELPSIDRIPVQRKVERLMNDTVAEVRQMPTRKDLARLDRRRQRSQTITVAIVAFIAIIGVLWGYFNSQTIAATQLNSASVQALDDVRTQLRAQGVPESQLPPPVTVVSGPDVDVNAIVQASSALVLAKIRSDPAYRGTPGLPGQPCQPTTPACVGAVGDKGIPGDPGLTPACVSTINACQGPPGVKGDQGEQGVKGDKGDTVVGPSGPTPDTAAFVGDGEPDCAYVVTYSDGKQVPANAPPAFCLLPR